MDTFITDGAPYWGWWVLGFLLLIAEILTPGTFFLWIGFAAFVTGVAAWLVPALSWSAEIVLFALLALAAVGLWFRYRPLTRHDAEDNGLNQRGRHLVGREMTLVADIVNGIGQGRLDDTVWRVAGPPLAAGSVVRVVGADGATLKVEPVAVAAGPAGGAH